MAVENLWPAKIVLDKAESPKNILQSQSALLYKMTNETVMADTHVTTGKDGTFRIQYFVMSKQLASRYELFSIEFGVTLYPVRFIRIHNAGALSLFNPKESECASPAEFRAKLKQVFAMEETLRVIMLIQMED